jgi:DNA-binding transcriptional regulator YiaG
MKQWTSKQIESFRKTFKLTRKALGQELGVTVSSIYQWERRLRVPSKTTKILLSRIESEYKKKGGI